MSVLRTYSLTFFLPQHPEIYFCVSAQVIPQGVGTGTPEIVMLVLFQEAFKDTLLCQKLIVLCLLECVCTHASRPPEMRTIFLVPLQVLFIYCKWLFVVYVCKFVHVYVCAYMW